VTWSAFAICWDGGWISGSLEGVECCSDDGGVAVTDSVGGFGLRIKAVKVRDVVGVRHLLGWWLDQWQLGGSGVLQ